MKPLLFLLCIFLLSSCDFLDELYSDGPYETYNENGQLESRGNYIDGKREGLWEWFDENGNLTETRTYRNGDLVETNSNPQQVFKPTK